MPSLCNLLPNLGPKPFPCECHELLQLTDSLLSLSLFSLSSARSSGWSAKVAQITEQGTGAANLPPMWGRSHFHAAVVSRGSKANARSLKSAANFLTPTILAANPNSLLFHIKFKCWVFVFVGAPETLDSVWGNRGGTCQDNFWIISDSSKWQLSLYGSIICSVNMWS